MGSLPIKGIGALYIISHVLSLSSAGSNIPLQYHYIFYIQKKHCKKNHSNSSLSNFPLFVLMFLPSVE